MRGLAGIAEINGPRRAELQAERARTIAAATLKAVNPRDTRDAHARRYADRVAEHKAAGFHPGTNQDPVPPMETIGAAIDQKSGSAFMEFWRNLNTTRGHEVAYGEARILFHGGPTPADAITFVTNGDGLRAIPVGNVQGAPAYHGEYREVSDRGTIWHKVLNNAQLPIVYATPKAALDAARWHRGARFGSAS